MTIKTFNGRWVLVVMAFLSAFTFFSCGDDEKDEPVEPGKKESVLLRKCSVVEGSEVIAEMTTSLTLSYNATVKIDPNAVITLNGEKIMAESSPTTKMDVVIPLSLQAGESYTLDIPSGAIISIVDESQVAGAFTLHFKTKEIVKPDNNLPDNEAVAMGKALGWGWNLGNHFDTSSGQDGVHPQWGWWDGATPTEALYQNLKAMGAGSVRIPVTWGNYQGASPSYAIEESYMEDVEKNVQWALNAGLYVVLNTHHDEYWQDIIAAAVNSGTNKAIEERIAATWTQIAERFKACGDHLIFETFNEIHDEAWGWNGGYNYRPVYNLMNEWNQIAVDAIRATGGNNATRWIGIPGFCANPGFTMDNLVLPSNDQRIMVGVHCYDPYNFCTEGSVQRWGHTYKGNDSNEEEINALFDRLLNKYIKNNIPCYMGEYGAVSRKSTADEPFRSYYLEYFCRSAYLHGIPVMLWDNNNNGGGERFYFINHKDGSFYNRTLVELMIKASTSDESSYTLESIYNSAPKK